jgi:hypothetical protein
MSLVREALAKAEREAAARAARERGLPERLSTAGQPYRASRRRPRWPLVLGAILATTVLAAAYLLLDGRPRSEAPEPGPPEASPAAGAQIREAAVDPPTGSNPPAAPDVPAEQLPEANAARPPDVAAGPASDPETADAGTVPTPPVAPPTESFVREAVLDGATRVVLGGIAWSEATPLAYLNGRLLAAGESVAGLRIERIERDRVELSGGGRRLILKLR